MLIGFVRFFFSSSSFLANIYLDGRDRMGIMSFFFVFLLTFLSLSSSSLFYLRLAYFTKCLCF